MSELVATLALIAVTLAGMAIYVQGMSIYYSGETGLLSGILRSSSEQNFERLGMIYFFENGTGLDHRLYFVVYNYGARNATIDRVIIDTVTMNVTPLTIPSNEVTFLQVNQALSGTNHVVSIITGRNNVFSMQFKTG